MSHHEMVHAWKDPDLRDAVCSPAHPAGEIALPVPELVGGNLMAAMMVVAASSEHLLTSGCCYCDCGCGVQYGCNREVCP
jgi:mersacidin/lichenicidin family type 2 lantibiotic